MLSNGFPRWKLYFGQKFCNELLKHHRSNLREAKYRIYPDYQISKFPDFQVKISASKAKKEKGRFATSRFWAVYLKDFFCRSVRTNSITGDFVY